MTKSFFILRSSLFVLFFLCFAFHLLGEDAVIQWTPQWKVGDQYTVEQIKERVTGKVTLGSKTPIDIEVKEKGEDYFILHCTYGASELRGAYGKIEVKDIKRFAPEAEQMASLLDGVCLKIKTRSDGLPIELLSVDEAMNLANKTIDHIESLNNKSKRPQDDVNQVTAKMRELFEKNPEMVSNMMLNELAPFFLFCGAELVLGQASEFEESLPNPFQGEPLPAKGSILLKEFNEQTGIATIEYKLTADDEKLGKVMFDSLNKLTPQKTIPPEEVEKMQASFSDRTLYKVDTKQGWAVSVEHERNIVVSDKNSKKQEIRRSHFKTLKNI